MGKQVKARKAIATLLVIDKANNADNFAAMTNDQLFERLAELRYTWDIGAQLWRPRQVTRKPRLASENERGLRDFALLRVICQEERVADIVRELPLAFELIGYLVQGEPKVYRPRNAGANRMIYFRLKAQDKE